MLTWLVDHRLGVAGRTDIVPSDARFLCVAAEYPDAAYPLVDEPILSMAQIVNFTSAVFRVREFYETTRIPLIVQCQQGRSRSVTVACTALALSRLYFEQDTAASLFLEILADLRTRNTEIMEHPRIQVLAEHLYPQIFKVGS